MLLPVLLFQDEGHSDRVSDLEEDAKQGNFEKNLLPF